MKSILIISFCITLAIPALEDFRTRTIRWYWIPLIFFHALWYSAQSKSVLEIAANSLQNVVILLCLAFVLAIYFLLKSNGLQFRTNGIIGIGDLLLLLSLTPLFEQLDFIFYLTASSALALLCHSIAGRLRMTQKSLVPLVSYLNITLILILATADTGPQSLSGILNFF